MKTDPHPDAAQALDIPTQLLNARIRAEQDIDSGRNEILDIAVERMVRSFEAESRAPGATGAAVGEEVGTR